jgi:hypothetical protein
MSNFVLDQGAPDRLWRRDFVAQLSPHLSRHGIRGKKPFQFSQVSMLSSIDKDL